MRTPITTISLGLAVCVAAAAGAVLSGGSGTAAAEPAVTFNVDLDGLGGSHTTQFFPGGIFDADVLNLTKGAVPYFLGLIIDWPFDTDCSHGRVILQPKDGPPEVHELGSACGLPAVFLNTGNRPNGDYAWICFEGTSDAAQPVRTCFPKP
ncbi:hypothetical protein [Nocardia sp. NBC_01327]|uniref:hypothetical protein n=1 Tax=Nocardia sp. NBC_01327 TaxID=2903593 RepID=UPI002E1515F3|nr:hypothetical protein OG326_29280 [Nocardia sp. NBC_01327]